jgi:hypothetical protein
MLMSKFNFNRYGSYVVFNKDGSCNIYDDSQREHRASWWAEAKARKLNTRVYVVQHDGSLVWHYDATKPVYSDDRWNPIAVNRMKG